MKEDILRAIGFRPKEAKILEYLYKNKDRTVTMRELELRLPVRQPEVSTAIKRFRERDWVKVGVAGKEDRKKGRPYFLVKFNYRKVKKDILADLDEEIKRLKQLRDEMKKF